MRCPFWCCLQAPFPNKMKYVFWRCPLATCTNNIRYPFWFWTHKAGFWCQVTIHFTLLYGMGRGNLMYGPKHKENVWDQRPNMPCFPYDCMTMKVKWQLKRCYITWLGEPLRGHIPFLVTYLCKLCKLYVMYYTSMVRVGTSIQCLSAQVLRLAYCWISEKGATLE